MIKLNNALKILIASTLLISGGCNKNQSSSDQKSDPASSSNTPSAFVKNNAVITALANNYSSLLQKKLDASTLSALSFKESVDAFLENPDNTHLIKAKQKWRENYLSFNQTAPFRVLQNQSNYNKAITNNIDSWPIMPGYIDAIPGFPHSGIVNDITLSLDEKNLRNQHALTSLDEVSIGFHAIEFLLWGNSSDQDTSDKKTNTNDAQTTDEKNSASKTGKPKNIKRFSPVTHWEKEDIDVSQHSNNRRRKYLSLATTLLLNDIENTNEKTKSIWQSNPGASQVFHALYMQLGEIRKRLHDFNKNPHSSASPSGLIHNDLMLHTHSIIELLEPIELYKQTDSNSSNTIQNLSLTIINIKGTLEELQETPEENGLWDKLDFNISQLESLLFTASNDSRSN